ADSVSYELLLGGVTIRADIFMEEGGNVGKYSIEIDTTQISDDEKYIIIISAFKSGFSIPSDLILQLDVSERDLILNQSDNNDSVSTVYWSEDVNMTLKAYGIDSETLTLENALFQNVDHTFNFVISDVEQQWNLSAIEFNIYGISWNTDITNINITIEDPYGEFYYLITNSTHSGWDYTQGTWTGILLDLNKASHNNDNNFEFLIGGSFDGSVDIVANAYFTRDSLNVQYSKFNISNEISLLTETEGWAISNVTFEIFDCYYTSNWSTVNLSNLTDLNITTNEGFKYSLDFGFSDGTGILTIDNRIIYPMGNQFLFTVESIPDVVFNAIIKIEYIQSFYKNLILETFNITKSVQGISNGGTFQIGATDGSWKQNEAELLINTIKGGSTYYFPSEVAMNITIGGQTYTIIDVAQGTGSFSLTGFSKNQILQAIIETSAPVNFSLFLSIEYFTSISQEVTGSLSYSIVEAPSIFGTVLYDQDLNYYLKTIDTSLLDADEYTVRFSFLKSHHLPAIKDLSIDVLNRPTLLNGSSEFFRTIQNIYVNDAINFTFLFTDALRGTKITNLKSQYYIWESYDTHGNVIDTGQGNIISTFEDTYIVDFDTETRDVGEYLLVLTVEKDNYNRKNAMILLTVNKRIINYTLGEPFVDFRSSIPQGNIIPLQLTLTDPTQGNIPLINATVEISIGGNIYRFNQTANGTYIYDFSTSHINTFFTSSTLAGTINITREDYISEEFTIIIVVEMEQIFGIPTFYFILVSSAIIVVVGSIVGYKVIQNAKIPTFVKKVREMKKAIKGNKDISESVLYNKKEVFVAEKVNHKWDKIGVSLSDKLDLEGQKIRKISKVERRISVASRSQESKPLGLIFMKWDERVGTEILAKYPEETVISEKTLMQIYSTHEYSGEKGVVTLSAGSLNIVSYYSGPEIPYYLVIILNLDDDPDLYEAGLPYVLRTLLDNIEDDTYIQLIPSLFQRLSLFPSLSEEEILALNYQDEMKQMIINNLRDIGVITKSELSVWLKDKFVEGFIDLEATLSEMIKREVVKQVSVKGLPSEIVVLINDYFMLRVPPVDLYENPTKNGLPSQFAKEYKSDIKRFFQDYRPNLEDNVKIIDILINPEVYLILKLLRTTIATREDLEKLRTKGVRDIYGALKLLWDAKMIKIFRDENNNEYYTLISDFYLDLIFPKYLLRAVKAAYEQKSIADKALMEYLDILEDTYYDLKSKKKK
ncbi:MAG: hypothetical protein ACXAAI_04490, partial [Promethearchaeota archaeon]